VFKVDRGSAGEKVAYLRLFSGTVRVRDRLAFAGRHGSHEGKVTAIEVFEDGGAVRRPSVTAGEIGRLRGLAEVQIGDVTGEPASAVEGQFAPPTLETVVVPLPPGDRGALHVALARWPSRTR
jgi:ribosomal protection tetracycline resistance protein